MSKIVETVGYDSSLIVESTYYYKTKTLIVLFKSGDLYIYKDVDEATYNHMRDADSVGSTFTQIIKGKFDYEHL